MDVIATMFDFNVIVSSMLIGWNGVNLPDWIQGFFVLQRNTHEFLAAFFSAFLVSCPHFASFLAAYFCLNLPSKYLLLGSPLMISNYIHYIIHIVFFHGVSIQLAGGTIGSKNPQPFCYERARRKENKMREKIRQVHSVTGAHSPETNWECDS